MVDVVVIGAGINGAATAYELARSGVSVVLLDRWGPAAMASGWTLAGVRQSGRHPAELPLAQAAVADWEHLAETLGGPTHYRQGGNLRLARGGVYREAPHVGGGVLQRWGGAAPLLLRAQAADPATMALARHGALRTVITVRSIEDSVASWIDTFGWSDAEAVDHLQAWIQLYIGLRGVALIVPYAQVDRRPGWAAWRIARFLYPGVKPFEVLRIARKFSRARVKAHADALVVDGKGVTDLGFSYFDEKTFFHRRHVSGLRSRPARERVPQARLDHVTGALEADIAAAGL